MATTSPASTAAWRGASDAAAPVEAPAGRRSPVAARAAGPGLRYHQVSAGSTVEQRGWGRGCCVGREQGRFWHNSSMAAGEGGLRELRRPLLGVCSFQATVHPTDSCGSNGLPLTPNSIRAQGLGSKLLASCRRGAPRAVPGRCGPEMDGILSAAPCLEIGSDVYAPVTVPARAHTYTRHAHTIALMSPSTSLLASHALNPPRAHIPLDIPRISNTGTSANMSLSSEGPMVGTTATVLVSNAHLGRALTSPNLHPPNHLQQSVCS